MILDELKTPAHREFMNNALQSCNYLVDILNSVLCKLTVAFLYEALERLDSANVPASTTTVDVINLLKTTYQLTSGMFPKKKIHFSVTANKGVPSSLTVSEFLLRQCLINLIHNAVNTTF